MLNDAAERTEPASPRKRKKAREEGQVARSTELIGLALLLAFLHAIPTFGPQIAAGMAEFMTQMFRTASQRDLDAQALTGMTEDALRRTAMFAGPILATIVAATMVGSVAQVGMVFTPNKLMPKFEMLNPIQGFKRMFQPRTLVELGKGFLKLGVVGWAGTSFLQEHWEEIFMLSGIPAAQIAPKIGELAHGMALKMTGALAIVAALDYAYQRWDLEKKLKMTKQEVKDEMRDTEGNPQIKGRVRQRMREMSRRRMIQAVPAATVIITNPTHFAVALQYELGQNGAPKVVAKGADFLAARIREVGRENNVPIVENPPLARALYRSVQVGQQIPTELFKAVAEVLAFVWQTGTSRVPSSRSQVQESS